MFFQRRPPPARLAHTVEWHVPRQQLLTPLGHRARIQGEPVGHPAVATVPQFERLHPLRRVVIKDDDGKRLTCLTNNFALTPELIAALYRQRWQVELFFEWITQHLRIKTFLGTSENAVKTQIWIAICTYALIAIAKKRLQLDRQSLYEILQILSLALFEQVPIHQLLTPPSSDSDPDFEPIQLALL